MSSTDSQMGFSQNTPRLQGGAQSALARPAVPCRRPAPPRGALQNEPFVQRRGDGDAHGVHLGQFRQRCDVRGAILGRQRRGCVEWIDDGR